MPNTRGVLNNHHKAVDFFSRLLDMGLLSGSLALASMLLGREWMDATTVVLLFGLVYFQLFASIVGLYAPRRSVTLLNQYGQLILALAGTFALLAISAYASNRFHFVATRKLLLLWFIGSLIGLGALRLCLRSLLGALRQHGLNTRCAAIVGTGPLGHALAEKFASNPWMGIRVGGFYTATSENTDASELPVRGDIQQLLHDANHGTYEHIYITLSLASQSTIQELAKQLRDTACAVYFVPESFVYNIMQARQHTVGELPVINMYTPPMSTADNLFKRAFDFFGALLITLLLAPLFFVIITAIKISSPGPVFYSHERIGRFGKSFPCYKFRSMVTNSAEVLAKLLAEDPNARAEWEAEFKLKNDPRITRIGQFLRKTSLDELPQLWNVIRGEMSLVGPRPIIEDELLRYGSNVGFYLYAKPGMTGLWQVSGRNDIAYDERVSLDTWYVRNWSFWNDITILFKTAVIVVRRKGAY